MSEVFISYAHEDCELASELAALMSERGVDVFWDREIKPGLIWDDVLERELDTASCVVVLWSAASVRSQWVRAEALAALQREVLVPALVQDVIPPLRFRPVHAADLTARPLTESAGLQDLWGSLRRCLVGPSSPASSRPSARRQSVPRSPAPQTAPDLGVAVSELQRLRDELLRVVHAPDGTLPGEETKRHLCASVEKVEQIYADLMPTLDDQARLTLHRAKKSVQATLFLLEGDSMLWTTERLNLPDRLRARLEEVREGLGEDQQLLIAAFRRSSGAGDG